AALLETWIRIPWLPPASQRYAHQRLGRDSWNTFWFNHVGQAAAVWIVVVVFPVGTQDKVAVRNPESDASVRHSKRLADVAVAAPCVPEHTAKELVDRASPWVHPRQEVLA